MLSQNTNHIYRGYWGSLILFLFLMLPVKCFAQKNIQRLPFRMVNNLIILPACINGSDTLQFILDTGLKNSIICELASGETLDLIEAREILVQGLGTGGPVEAIQSVGNTLEVGGLRFENQDFVVLSNNILQLSHKMGSKIHGMLSMQAFYQFVVEIDYDRRLISLIPPESFDKPVSDKYASLPLQMESGKPFLVIYIKTRDGSSFPVKLLLDSGASNAIWLNVESLEEFTIPENSRYCYLGCGIGGDVQGMMSRVKQVDIGPYSLNDVLVSYPDSLAIAQQEPVVDRNGSMGSEILRRFNIILDFPGKKIHIRPNRAFSQKFYYDMSGIDVIAQVPGQGSFVISRIREGSVADLAGARTGDRIQSINKVTVNHYSLDDIYLNLQGRKGKKVRMVILRGEERIKLSFHLEKYI